MGIYVSGGALDKAPITRGQSPADAIAKPTSCNGCRGGCCRSKLLYLSRSEADWMRDNGTDLLETELPKRKGQRLYQMAGACALLDAETHACTAYEQRPAACREFQLGSAACATQYARSSFQPVRLPMPEVRPQGLPPHMPTAA